MQLYLIVHNRTSMYVLALLCALSIHSDTFVYSSPDVSVKCFGKRRIHKCLSFAYSCL